MGIAHFRATFLNEVPLCMLSNAAAISFSVHDLGTHFLHSSGFPLAIVLRCVTDN